MKVKVQSVEDQSGGLKSTFSNPGGRFGKLIRLKKKKVKEFMTSRVMRSESASVSMNVGANVSASVSKVPEFVIFTEYNV